MNQDKLQEIEQAAEEYLTALGMDKGETFNECKALIKWGAEWHHQQQPALPDEYCSCTYRPKVYAKAHSPLTCAGCHKPVNVKHAVPAKAVEEATLQQIAQDIVHLPEDKIIYTGEIVKVLQQHLNPKKA